MSNCELNQKWMFKIEITKKNSLKELKEIRIWTKTPFGNKPICVVEEVNKGFLGATYKKIGEIEDKNDLIDFLGMYYGGKIEVRNIQKL